MNNRMNDINNVAGNAYCNLEEYVNELRMNFSPLTSNDINSYIISAEKLLDNDNISDQLCAEKICDLMNALMEEVADIEFFADNEDWTI